MGRGMPKVNKRLCCIGIGIIIVSAWLSAFHFQLLLVRGDSMKPTYTNLSLVVLDKHGRTPERGDVVVFRRDGIGALIKRAVGLPGDSLTVRGDSLLVNGEPAAGYEHLGDPGLLEAGVTLGEDEYFVLGDNLAESHDSRFPEVGIVHGAEILGKVIPLRERTNEP